MEKIIVKGGNKLHGTVRAGGAKNAALPILAASLLPNEGNTILKNVPVLADVFNMQKVLEHLNVPNTFNVETNELVLENAEEVFSDTPYEFMNRMRASVVVMGPLLARNGYARVAMPGGCSIGSRPIDLHLKGFEAMGAKIEVTEGYVVATADHLSGAPVYLDFPSVGATENIMMAAVMADGVTTIDNAAREPEIVDLANFLNKMGAKVSGAGTSSIRITGVDSLKAVTHSIIPDRIEAGTFAVAAAITQGDVFIEDFVVEHNKPLISKLREMGTKIEIYDDGIRVMGQADIKPTNVETLPYPGFPTDLQAPMTIMQLASDGTSVMKETIFENRFMHMEQLRKMDAKFDIDNQSLIIYGGQKLEPAEVAGTDLRAAAALIIAGLITEGYTRVVELKHLDRGYYRFAEKLKALGADIDRVDSEGKSVLTETQDASPVIAR